MKYLALRRLVVAAVAAGAPVVGIVVVEAAVVVVMHLTFVGFCIQLMQLGSDGATSQVTAPTNEGRQ